MEESKKSADLISNVADVRLPFPLSKRARECKLILFDLDGTLLDSQKNIRPESIEALEKCRIKGILVGIATARSEQTCSRIIAEVNPDVVISNGGGLVRVGGEIVYNSMFTEEETALLVSAAVAENRGVTVDSPHGTYCNCVIDSADWSNVTITDFSDFHDTAFKVCIEGTDADFAERTAALVDDCVFMPFSDCDWFKFSRRGASKESAIPPVERALGIWRENIIAFGDDYVDAEMLRCCGVGVAMGNSIDLVSKSADVTIGDNDSDAIAQFIGQNIL